MDCMVEDRDKLADELKRADAVVLTYAYEYDLTSSIDRVTTFWLTELRRLEVRVPVIVVGCKSDKQFAQRISLEQSLTGVYEQFPEIELWTECSAYLDIEVICSSFCMCLILYK
ncbi:putative P-loop containing nucleoside triphosphate hydrolase [Helianthus anomalus]